MNQPALHYGALLDFDALVVDIAFDPGTRLEFEAFRGVHGPVDGPVDHDMGRLHLAVDAGLGGHHEGARLVRGTRHVAAHEPVDAQPARKDDVALDAGRRPDEAVDAVLRLAALAEHGPSLPKPAIRGSQTAACSAATRPSRRCAPARFRTAPCGSPGKSPRLSGNT